MSSSTIENFDLSLIANDNDLNMPAMSSALNISSEAAGAPPLTRAPDRPSSTR
jgi:hypothetical protein